MELWLRHLRHATRRLRRSPGFTFTVILTLALGIGANTAIFSVVYGVLFRPLGYRHPAKLVAVRENIAPNDPDLPVNANHFVFWRKEAHSFSGLAALLPESLPLGGGQPEEIGVAEITANLFSVLGVQPRIGRAFLPSEEKPGQNDVAILTDALWRRKYAANSNVVGEIIMLDGKLYRIAGVLPANFSFPNASIMGGSQDVAEAIQAFVPFAWSADLLAEVEGDHNYFAIGRLKQNATLAQAAELNVLQRSLSQRTPDKARFSATVTPLQEYLTGSSRRSLMLLLAAVSSLLLIACVNIANLLLMRAAASAHESAVRKALGGTRLELFGGAFAEPILLCLAGGILGITLAVLAVPLLIHNAPAEVAGMNGVSLNEVVLAFAIGLSIAATLICGTASAWRYSRGAIEPALRANSRTTSQSRAGKSLRNGFVMAEVAGSLGLAVIAGLFITSLFKLQRVERGFDAEHVLSAKVALPDGQYSEPAARNAFYERALSRLRQLPGVEAAGIVSVLPLDGDYWGDLVSRIGDTRPLFERPGAHFRWISPGYFESLMQPLLEGRFLDAADRGKRVAILSKRVAETVWPGENPIGQKFLRGNPDDPPFEVIGVVGDVRSLGLSEQSPPMVYVPYWYRSRTGGSFVLRTRQDPQSLITSLRQAIASIERQAPVTSVRTMTAVVSGSVSRRRFETRLLAGFAMAALLLAGVGIYGVVAYSAAQRTQEIGIRMAIGAEKRDIYRLIVGEGVVPVLLGALVGIGGAWFLGRFFAELLFQTKTYDPLVMAGSGMLLLAIGIAACLGPARRAARTEPVEALRHE